MKAKPYGSRVIRPETIGLTAAYYHMNGGGCRRTRVVWRSFEWYIDEHPYDDALMKLCHRPGKHPHRGKPIPANLTRVLNRLRRRERKRA